MNEVIISKPEQDPGTDDVIIAQGKASRYHVDNMFGQPFMLALAHASYQHLIANSRRAYGNEIVHRARDPRLVLNDLRSAGNGRYQFADDQSHELATIVRNRSQDTLNGIADVHALGDEQLHLARVITSKPYQGITSERDPILLVGVNNAGARDPNYSDMVDGQLSEGKEAYYFYLTPDPKHPGRTITCVNRVGHVYKPNDQYVFDQYGNPLGRRAGYADVNVLAYTAKQVHDKRFNPEYPIKQLTNPNLEIIRFNAEVGMYSVAAAPLPEDLYRFMFPESPELANFMELVRKFEIARLPQITKIEGGIGIGFEDAWRYLRLGKRDEFMARAAQVKGQIIQEISKQSIRMTSALMKYKRLFRVTLPAPMRTTRMLETAELPMWQNALCAIPTRFEDLLTLYGAIRAYELSDHPYHVMAHEIMTENPESESIFDRPSRYILDLGRHQMLEEMKAGIIASFGDPAKFPHLARAIAAIGKVDSIEGLLKVNSTIMLLEAADNVAKANAGMESIPESARRAFMTDAQIAATKQLPAPAPEPAPPAQPAPPPPAVVEEPPVRIQREPPPRADQPDDAELAALETSDEDQPPPAVPLAPAAAPTAAPAVSEQNTSSAEATVTSSAETDFILKNIWRGRTVVTAAAFIKSGRRRRDVKEGKQMIVMTAEEMIDLFERYKKTTLVADILLDKHGIVIATEDQLDQEDKLAEDLRILYDRLQLIIQDSTEAAEILDYLEGRKKYPFKEIGSADAVFSQPPEPTPAAAQPAVLPAAVALPKKPANKGNTEIPLRGPEVAQYIINTYWRLKTIVERDTFFNYAADRRDVFEGRGFMRLTSADLARIPEQVRKSVVAAINEGNIILAVTADEMGAQDAFGIWARELRVQAKALILDSIEDEELKRMLEQSQSEFNK